MELKEYKEIAQEHTVKGPLNICTWVCGDAALGTTLSTWQMQSS